MVYGPGMSAWTPAGQVPQLTGRVSFGGPPPVPPIGSRPGQMRSHEIDYEIFGNEMQYAEVTLDPGETLMICRLTLAPGTGLGQVTIPADGSYQAPAGQTLILGTGDAFNLTVTVSATNAVAGDVPFTTTQAVPAV